MSDAYQIYNGDCLDVLPALASASVDAVITDPPAGISFMGMEFDSDRGGRNAWIAWLAGIMKETRRVLRPGHYALVWALPRTSHWTGMALEDAGFIVKDRLAYIFGSGFPKHKHALKPAVEDWWLVRAPGKPAPLNIEACRIPSADNVTFARMPGNRSRDQYRMGTVSGPALPAAGRWPAHLLLSHAPDCRQVGTRRVKSGTAVQRNRDGEIHNQVYGAYHKPPAPDAGYADADGYETVTDWVCAEGCPVALLDAQSVWCGKSRGNECSASRPAYDGGWRKQDRAIGYGDTGGASRYFSRIESGDYVPFLYGSKASRRERNEGCEGLDGRSIRRHGDTGPAQDKPNGQRAIVEGNHHPCVKSIALMRWLISLITPEGGTVLDPFAGSGSTGVAAMETGRQFIGVEMSPEYFAIAQARIAHAAGTARQLEMAV